MKPSPCSASFSPIPRALLQLVLVLSLLLAATLSPAVASTEEEKAAMEKRKKEGPYIAVSVRKFQSRGPSRIHLYLYAKDGTLKKQLTDDARFHDLNPVFDYDGNLITFRREAVAEANAAMSGEYVLDVNTGKITRVKTDSLIDIQTPANRTWRTPEIVQGDANFERYTSPDGKYLLRKAKVEAEGGGTKGEGSQYMVSTDNGAKDQRQAETDITMFEGYPKADIWGDSPDNLSTCNDSPFLLGKDFAAIIMWRHKGSSDGNGICAVDLITRKWTILSHNGGTVYHPSSQAGLYIATQERYEPLPDRPGHTVNCSYLDWYGPDWKRVRYSPPVSAFYSATIWAGPNEIICMSGEGVRG